MHTHRVVIVGAGFGGLKAALELARDSRFTVTLVTDQPDFRFYPALYHTASGGPSRVSAIPIKEIIGSLPVEIIEAKATKIDRKNQELVTKGSQRLAYDSIILGLGMTTNFFGIPGMEEYSYGIKSVSEATRLKDHLHQQIQKEQHADHHYIIVGGGPTGVELAGMLPGYLHSILRHHGLKHQAIRVDLVEAAPRLLPRLPKDVGRATSRRLRKLGVHIATNQQVQAETASELIINGKPSASHTVIWTAGVSCNPFFADNNFKMSEHHRVEVNEYLEAEPNIFVIGDNAETEYSGVAQTALHDGLFVAEHLKRVYGREPYQPYKPRRPVYVTPVGPRWAAVVWGQLHIYGLLGWMVREAADFIAYHDYQPWWPAAQRWLALHTNEESCPVCGSAQAAD